MLMRIDVRRELVTLVGVDDKSGNASSVLLSWMAIAAEDPRDAIAVPGRGDRL
jgi:hypothetical protein